MRLLFLLIPILFFFNKIKAQSDTVWIHHQQWDKWEQAEIRNDYKYKWDETINLKKFGRNINRTVSIMVCYNILYHKWTWISVVGTGTALSATSVGVQTCGIVYKMRLRKELAKRPKLY